MDAHIPQYLPPTLFQGYTNEYLRNKERNFIHRTQGLSYGQGFRKVKPASAQAAFITDDPKLDCDQVGDLVKLGCLNPEFYKPPLQRATNQTLSDENALLKEKNAESTPEKPFLKENYRVRKFVLYFYTADDTIKIWENRQLNTGFVQGTYLGRRRYEMPGKESVCYKWFDLNVGLDIDLSGHLFHIYDSDGYTRHYFEYNGSTVKMKEACPEDPYLSYCEKMKINDKNRSFSFRQTNEEDQLSRFIRTDGQKLCFEVVMDDSVQKAGDIRRMVLRYYIYDATLELVQIPTKNSGYDPASAVIRRQKIPKNFYNDIVLQIGDKTVPQHYTAGDLRLGETLLLFGRKVTICDCDEYTKKWYRDNMQITEFNKVDSATLLPQRAPLPQPVLPTWSEGNRQGGYLDSLQNCLHLDPQPVIADSLQRLYYSQECLRYEAKLVTQEPEEKERRFIINYFVGDSSIKIVEVANPCLNITRSTFLARRQLTKLNQPNQDNPPVYFSEQDFTIGSVHLMCGRLFEIINCDEHVINFALKNPGMYTHEQLDQFRQAIAWHSKKNHFVEHSDDATSASTLEEKVRNAVWKLKRWQKVSHQRLYQLFLELDKDGKELITKDILRTMCGQLGVSTEDEVLEGIFHLFDAPDGKCVMQFTRFLHALNMVWHGVKNLPGETGNKGY
ncbi:EF-hand domain-containing protein 1 [Hypsibius exemplaris]|uniref:EF-hand domain-containing protein 1 n=1 Tax=Hypsibius exemplaris TaxID=2072580 RepID=A0A1W0WLL4_HYPEX|nr:EF-hand domain-containing protein 1 [Hypsibius exemplaris]